MQHDNDAKDGLPMNNQAGIPSSLKCMLYDLTRLEPGELRMVQGCSGHQTHMLLHTTPLLCVSRYCADGQATPDQVCMCVCVRACVCVCVCVRVCYAPATQLHHELWHMHPIGYPSKYVCLFLVTTFVK